MRITDRRNALERAISSLEALAYKKRSKDESEYQAWFEANPIVFECLAYGRHVSQPKCEYSYQREDGRVFEQPDFVVEGIDNTWEILELKTPYTKVLAKRKRRNCFYKAFNTYLGQLDDYMGFFSHEPDRNTFGTVLLSRPRGGHRPAD